MTDNEERAKVLDEKRNVTGRISDTCRIVGFGLLTVFYTIKVGDEKLSTIDTTHSCLVLAVGIAGFAILVFDYLQYFFGSMAVEAAMKAKNKYDEDSIAYKARKLFFYLKQYAVFVGVGLLVWLFLVI